MKAGANATIEDEPTTDVAATINKIDEQLEKFIGIRDLDLSTTMHQLAKTATEPEIFAGLLDQHLSDFEFPDDFVLDVCAASCIRAMIGLTHIHRSSRWCTRSKGQSTPFPPND